MSKATGLRSRARAAGLAACILATVTHAPDVHADAGDAKQRKADALALFDEALELTAQGKYAEACPKLEASLQLNPGTGTRFYLADCLEHVGQLASAWIHYVDVVDATAATGQKAKEKYARARVDALEPRLTRLAVVVSDGARSTPGLAVRRDDAVLVEAQWGVAVPVDPGPHKVSATAIGMKRWETTAKVDQEGQTVTVTVPPLERAESAPPSATAHPAPTTPLPGTAPLPDMTSPSPVDSTAPMTGKPMSDLGSPLRTAGLVAGGVGLVGLAVGAGFGMNALSKNREGTEHCYVSKGGASKACTPKGGALLDDSAAAATASTASFIAGGVALATGAALLLLAPPAKPRSRRTDVATGILLGPDGISLVGRW
ncbi:hypothetical protein WME90_24400 [Sorangium sp. So ce375]|uniref:hypothetical protein n=1 Tax=Sorangium sp. So ce375 TaxID=3133306 RepID=UPI003F5B43DD